MNEVDIILITAPSPHPLSMLSHRVQGLPPLGLCYIATYLKQNGYKVKILDFSIRKVTLFDLDEVMQNNHPKLIGISTTTETYNCGMRIAKYIKEKNAATTVFMGGCHVTYEYEDALNSGVVDIVSRNEGEITTKELCDLYINNIGSLQEIDGISYIKDGVIVSNQDRKFIENLDSLPIPDRSFFDIKEYGIPASISTSRGCPGQCIFCAASGLSGGRYRRRSAESIIEEIKYLIDLGFHHIQFVDDTLTADLKRLHQVLDMIIEQELNITFVCESRVDIVTFELLEKLKKAGCKMIQYGVEAGSQEMLDCLKKNITMEQILRVFEWCNQLEIQTASCLIIGQPYDTHKTIQDTINIALKLQELGARIVFSISTPYPGTYMYNHTDEFGIKIVDHDFDNYTTQTAVYDSKNLTAKQIHNLFFQAYYALNKVQPPENIKKYRNMMKIRQEDYLHDFGRPSAVL
ncbi:B12-binding domain-containing radical SAM protein [Lachnoclostridium phytofermentans]|uniref:Radical SAM domain protein n=1 Tax=Lachnoclostridium phytofermentans (strain ATCC 700394 / DSM 18823 / ISDg) TaxID=357809 RepID=A9KIR0_LACP7|nr:radical SAM protein [Lachnoclostridium phytofermentans]ABX43923.1 Radical SAM domain protein [Lachnoclostridium phytofermentans ISDg]